LRRNAIFLLKEIKPEVVINLMLFSVSKEELAGLINSYREYPNA
jgi:hypothetical protein